MSTSKTYQQSLADAGSETRPPMLERGSYIPWASRFRRYINREIKPRRKWLNKALDEGPYQFQMFVPTGSTLPTLQTAEDLQGDELLHYDAEIELMNLILLSIPNEIYNSVDACTTAKEMWKRVERLMRGTIQNQVDRETRFTNEFDQFVAEPGEALVSVYNRFAQLMNDLERNKMIFPIVTVNTKFLNSLQPEWLKYVTQVRLAKRLTVDSFDDLFDYLCGKGHYARNCPNKSSDSKYFMEQMLQAKRHESWRTSLPMKHYDFYMMMLQGGKEIKELNTIGDDQIDSNIIFDEPNGNVNSGSVEKDTHVPDLYALE
ncbi:hypothetical protein Tco_0420372 [Tanacetum coccineum]